MKLGIAIPTYNEATNIESLLRKLHSELHAIDGLQTTVLVIDDGSPDGTATIVTTAAAVLRSTSFKVELLPRATKDGLGKAYVAGFKKLLELKCDYILQMDADHSHDPVYVPAFVEAARSGHDFVVGTRYIVGGDTPDWSASRRMLSKYGNLYSRFFLGSKITDFTGGFNMYSADLLKQVKLDTLQSAGYGFQIELKYRALKIASSTYEIPIIFMDRRHGKSKIPRNTLTKNMVLVVRLRMGR